MAELITTINPATGKVLNKYKKLTSAQISKALNDSEKGFHIWKAKTISERVKLISALGKTLLREKARLAKLMTDEMGKPITQSLAEIEKCAKLCEYYAKNGKDLLKDEIVKTEYKKSYISFEPLGVILAIMPWNFPFWQALRAAIPIMLSGNAVVLKHSSSVSGCAIEIEKLFLKAGFEKNIFKTFIVSSDQIEEIIANKIIKAVTLTGSTEAGKSVASIAGKHIKKCVLELGGSDPYIVLKDADISKAVDICVKSKMINAGQSCISAKRFIIEENIYNRFLNEFKARLEKIHFGSPTSNKTLLGSLSSIKAKDDLHSQIQQAVKNGAKLILGGTDPKNNAFYPNTILTNITKNNPAFTQEFFGPVALVFKAKNEKEAVEIANATDFGLGAAIFTKNISKAQILAKQINSGSVFINDFVKSDPRLPFGGVKQSGYGREISYFGVREFVNVKTIVAS